MATKAKTVNLNNIPPVPVLQLALVGLVDGRLSEMVNRLKLSSTDKLRRIAILARELSKKNCFFCGLESNPKMKKADQLEWESLPICGCLAPLRAGYREYYPWRQQVQQIHARVQAWLEARKAGRDPLAEGGLDPEAPMYSNTCNQPGCSIVFTCTAGNISGSIRRHNKHEEWRKCRSCAQKHAALRAESGASKAEVPPARQRLTATLGESQRRKAGMG